MERWLAYFANRLTKEEKEELAMSEPAIRDAMEAEKIFMSSPEEYLRYVNHQIALMDYQSGLEGATLEGLAQGIAQGRREGRAEGRAEGCAEGRQLGTMRTALKFISAGTPLKEVAQIAEVSEDELREFARKKGVCIS